MIRLKQIKLSMIQVEKQLKYLLCLSDLEKYEDLTGEDLGHRPSVLEKTKFEYSPLGMSLSKSFKKDNIKNIAKSENDFIYDSNYGFYKFYKSYDEFKELSLCSKYNKIREINKPLTKFKALKSKNPKTQLKKERIMKNVDEHYENYYSAYKDDYDAGDELNEAKKKEFNGKQFQLFDKAYEESELDEKTNKEIEKEIGD